MGVWIQVDGLLSVFVCGVSWLLLWWLFEMEMDGLYVCVV